MLPGSRLSYEESRTPSIEESPMKKSATAFLGAIVFLLISALPLAAQNAALVGTVRDQQGGAMPNVTVTVTSTETGVSMSTSTDATGNYEFPTVKPGTYRVRVEQKGFQTFVQSGIVLAVEDRLRLDPVMQIGETTSVVTVEALVTTVSTESS